MTEVSENSGSYPKVRDLIFVYERNTSVSEPLQQFEGRRRAKSIGNALSYKQFCQPNLEIHNIVDIEKELVKIEAHLNYYEIYEKETHVAFQEQLFNILTSIVNIDPEGHESTIQKKKELIEATQKLSKVLNTKLPFDNNHSHLNVRRNYSQVVRKEEAVVSSTSVKTSSSSFLNKSDLKSEESLNSADLSSRQEESVLADFNALEEKSESTTPPPSINIISESEASYIPSVSRLKKFFSFRRDNKAEIKVIPAAYSGVTRSQSLNLKTNKYTVSKRETNTYSDATISENDEDKQNDDNSRLITSSPLPSKSEDGNNEIQHNVEISLYNEPTEEIEEYREERETQHNVSVSKLKSMFEEKQKESDEGLGLLTKKQFRSDFSLPYTEANLGAFRLKRTISGNYMNFTGLLKSVDIQKKVDLNKSKSLSDLKSDSFGYTVRDIEVNDLSKELDNDDDFEHVTIKLGAKRTEEVNNNDVVRETEMGSRYAIEEHVTSSTVGSLKHTFEQVNTIKTTDESNKNIEQITHKEISGSVPSPIRELEKPLLKTPPEFEERISTAIEQHALEQKINEKTIREDVKNVFHKTMLVKESNKPVLEMPNLIKADLPYDNHTEKHTATGTVESLKHTFEQTNTRERQNEDIICDVHNTSESISSKESCEVVLEVPAKIRTDYPADNGIQENVFEENKKYVTTATVETLKHTFEKINTEQRQNEDIKYDVHTITEPISSKLPREVVSEVPVYFGTNYSTDNDIQEHLFEKRNAYVTMGAVESLKQTFEQKTSEENNEDMKDLVDKTTNHVSSVSKESDESVQIKIDVATNNQIEEQTSEIIASNDHMHEEQHVVTGTVETLKQTFEHVNAQTVQENKQLLSYSTNSSEKSLQVPVQSNTGFANISHTKEDVAVGENHATEEERLLTGTVEALKETFERSDSQLTKENVEDLKYTSSELESTSSSIASLNRLLLKVPMQFTTDFSAVSRTEKQVAEHLTTESKEESSNGHVKQIVHSTTKTIPACKYPLEKTTLKVPTEFRIGFSSVSSNEEQLKERTTYSETSSSRELIANKTQSLMEILESPTSLSALVSNSSHSGELQVSSSSNVSVSYSQKTSVQRTSSTQVSHQIVSSSSSAHLTEQSSQSYLQVQQEPSSYSILTSYTKPNESNEGEEDTITITEIEDSGDDGKSKKRVLSLNISQENILDEILDDSKEFKDVDEEFEKILSGN